MAKKLYGDAAKLQKILKGIGVNVSDKQMQAAIKTVSSGGGKTPTPTPTPTPAPVSKTTTAYSGPSIVDYLASTGGASDYASRAKLAAEKGITNYTGTAEQNTQLLNTLRGSGATATTPTTLGVDTTGNEYLPYREGDIVPGKGRLLPDGTFAPDTTTPAGTTTSDMSQEQFIQMLKDKGIITTPKVTETTPSDLLGNIPTDTKLDKQIANAEQTLLDLKNAAANETDEQVRQRITDLFQKEIDSLNALYAQQKVEATKAGLGALGTSRAQQARFGLLGSTFGTAETAGIETQTEEKKKAIDVANQAALSPIYNKIGEEVLNARKAKKEAQAESAQAYIDYLKNQKSKKAEIATNAIKSMLLNKAVPTDKDFIDMAKQIGVDPTLFKQEYLTTKKGEEDTLLKEKTDLIKTINTDNGTFVTRDGGLTWTPLAGSAKPEKIDKVTPLSILDIQRYNEAYPDANVTAGDTEATANVKVAQSNSPEVKSRNLILGAKEAGDTYETVLNDINTTSLFSDKVGAKKILDEIYGKTGSTAVITSKIDARASQLAKNGMTTGSIRNILVNEGYTSSEAIAAANKANNEDFLNSTINSISNALFR